MIRNWSSVIEGLESDVRQYDATLDVHLDLGTGFESAWIYPGGFALVATQERFQTPQGIVLTVHDLSTLARQGISVGNTVIQPGSRGHQTIELWNGGPRPVALHQGMPIAQLVQHETRSAFTYSGRYQDQTRGPHAAR